MPDSPPCNVLGPVVGLQIVQRFILPADLYVMVVSKLDSRLLCLFHPICLLFYYKLINVCSNQQCEYFQLMHSVSDCVLGIVYGT